MFWAELSHLFILIDRWLKHAAELVCGSKVTVKTSIVRFQLSRSPAVTQSFLRLTREDKQDAQSRAVRRGKWVQLLRAFHMSNGFFKFAASSHNPGIALMCDGQIRVEFERATQGIRGGIVLTTGELHHCHCHMRFSDPVI